MFFQCRCIVFLIIVLLPLVSCKQSVQAESTNKSEIQKNDGNVKEEKPYPKFDFSKEIHKFGIISEGEIIVCEFYFRNTGNANLIIKSIESSCGCTAVKWNKKPIKVGEESKITVEFNSKGRHGKQYKVLTIFANTKRKVKELKITATIK
ncbi:DUF1573 domain-containing protein [Ancylomarina euxinus]|uniref:DUF1573 domain-containing protein n=1 Tax=Ancylomarina euxinus TaxID=2283627 RepID=A0A425Y1H2_9BACT|nr:DUF1573 domain-containing protein [Ancylomarina euxinus]MCZ4695160.1 DUF1573 domain-containing protein [Ancylomarina euxinus]MUP14906.1 DUF1573 domain-containing protein [Ancylomarina euxinus]RRG21800.1 DUF1573 domain-containing protein [Ancylomarina euxinus]